MVYVCGDGAHFDMLEDAVLHATLTFKRTGNVISIEHETPLDAVCGRYGLQAPQTTAEWKQLAMAIMKAREPEFRNEDV